MLSMINHTINSKATVMLIKIISEKNAIMISMTQKINITKILKINKISNSKSHHIPKYSHLYQNKDINSENSNNKIQKLKKITKIINPTMSKSNRPNLKNNKQSQSQKSNSKKDNKQFNS